jgi:heptosyltransferase-1
VKILIIKPSSLGDVIHALPFLKAIKDTFPDSVIDWVISKSLKDILDGNPLINELIIIDKDSWKDLGNIRMTSRELINLKKGLKKSHYDMVIDLQGLLRSGIISLFTSSSQKIGFADAREGSRYLYDRRVSVNGISHAVDKNLEVARAIGARIQNQKVEFPLFVDRETRENVKHLIRGIDEYIIIIPSARWHSKRWPEENFASLISRMPIPCIIAGSKYDRAVAQRIYELSQKRPVDLCGKTNLKKLSALISDARMVISGDTGPMHIAVALEVPVVTLFGPTDPQKTGPYGWQKKDNIRVIRINASCSPCRKKRCKDPFCMTNITVDTVLEEVNSLL